MQPDPVRNCELFRLLDDEQFAHIADRLKFSAVNAGQNLYDEGEPADSVSIVIEGALEVYKIGSRTNSTVVLSEFGPSDVIGEMALLSDPERSATVRATMPSRLASFSRAAFGTLERQRPDIALAMLKGVVRILSRRLQDTSADLADER